MLFPVAESWRKWLAGDVQANKLNRFRTVFALVWLTYDVCDILVDGTWTCLNPLQRLHPEVSPALPVQSMLVVCELGLLSGRFPVVFCLAAAALRFYQTITYYWLNDFFYYGLTALLMGLAYFEGDGLSKSPTRIKAWMVDVLRVQLGFTYVATAVMKMNPSWLSGSHLHVRVSYLHKAFDWPYPDVFLRCMNNKPCASAHAWTAVILELLLGLLVIGGRFPRLSLLLALGIHGFAALTTNVWFFGASIVAHVAFLAGRDAPIEDPSPPSDCVPNASIPV